VSGLKKQVTTFVLEGRFLEALGKSPLKPKYLRLATAEGEQLIKLSKEVRPLVNQKQFPVGTWITVSGRDTYKPKKGKWKRKIHAIEPHQVTTTPSTADLASYTAPLPATKDNKNKDKKNKKKEKENKKENILVCQKSSCCKRGGKAVYQAAQEAVEKHELHDRVQVKPTGCMGKCKKGPCVVMQGNKSRHLGVAPEQVKELIGQQYGICVS
jgi:hypothetical protein